MFACLEIVVINSHDFNLLLQKDTTMNLAAKGQKKYFKIFSVTINTYRFTSIVQVRKKN